MKVINFFIFLFLISNSLMYSQSTFFNVSETEPFKDVKYSTTILDVHNFEEGEVLVIRESKKLFLVNDFSKDHVLLNNIEIKKEKKESYLGSYATDEGITFFSSLKTSKTEIELYAHTYNYESQKASKKLLYSVTERGKKSKFKLFKRQKHQVSFRVSPNGDYVAFTVDNINNKANSQGVRVYDTQLNELYSRSYELNEKKVFAFDDFVITNDAAVICAGFTHITDKKRKKDSKSNYDYTLYKITKDQLTSKQIELGDNYVNEVRFSQTENSIRMLGFYSERSSNGMKGGVSYLLNGSDINTVSFKETPFPAEVYQDIYREKKAVRKKDKQKELKRYYLDYSLTDDEGNGYLVAEQFYTTTRSVSTGNGGFYTETIYHYANILILKFNVEGTLVWGRTILKHDLFPSYQPFVAGNRLHILLNSGKNVGEKSDGRKKLKKGLFEKLSLFDISFDPATGDQKMESLREGRKGAYQPNLGSYGFDSFVMTNFSKNKKQFFILTKK